LKKGKEGEKIAHRNEKRTGIDEVGKKMGGGTGNVTGSEKKKGSRISEK